MPKEREALLVVAESSGHSTISYMTLDASQEEKLENETLSNFSSCDYGVPFLLTGATVM